MSAISAVSNGPMAAQMGQVGQAAKQVNHDRDHDGAKPSAPPEQAKQAATADQHRVDVEA